MVKVEIPPVRLALYVTLTMLSFILFCISAARLHYTTHLQTGDPLNNGLSFYDPIVAELLFTALITTFWSIFVIVTMFQRLEFRFVTSFLGEIVTLSFLWLFWIIGASIATSIWGTLFYCRQYSPCRVLSALLAFAWLGWITLTVLMVVTVLFSIANNALKEPLHGKWDPRISIYSARTSRGF